MNNFDLKAYLASQRLFEAEQTSDEAELEKLDNDISSAFASGLTALFLNGSPPVTAFGISFPTSNSGLKAKYFVNNIAWENDYGPSE